MPTGATLVVSHGQSRENNSWASASAPNAGAVPRDERDEEEQAGRKGEISEAELYRLLGSQYRHKFVLKVEKPRRGEGGQASLYEPGSLNKWGCTAASLFSFFFQRINNIAFSTGTFARSSASCLPLVFVTLGFLMQATSISDTRQNLH